MCSDSQFLVDSIKRNIASTYGHDPADDTQIEIEIRIESNVLIIEDSKANEGDTVIDGKLKIRSQKIAV